MLHRNGRPARSGSHGLRTLLAGGLLLGCGVAWGQQSGDSDWPVATGNDASQRYAPLDQIDRHNFDRLDIAWRWSSPDNDLMTGEDIPGGRRTAPRNHEAIPIKVGDRLYVTTGYGQIAAVDIEEGASVWTYDPRAYRQGRPTNLGFTHRGAAYWNDPDLPEGGGRLLWAAGDSFLRAVDTLNGEPIASFGDGGAVDLTLGLRREVPRRTYSVSSPVTLCRDVAIVGSSISDGPRTPEAPPGDVRGFDVRTGEQLWTFHSIPQAGEPGRDTWEDGAWKYSGNTNVWTLMSADPELGLAYLPFGTPTNDWYGGHRLGDNLYAESLVAVDCETGERRWHFQMVHHGLWDYDLPTSAILGDIEVGGRTIRAAMQLSKQAFLYVFDARTGEPVWPILEREVPQTGIVGERTSATQPFPTRPPPFDRQGIGPDDLIDFTPRLRSEARAILSRYQYGPMFTPPTERGTFLMPGYGGGASWPGGAFDPETGMLYVPSFTWPVINTLRKPDPNRSSFDYVGRIDSDVRGPRDLPLVKPPYSRITAYDMNRGEIAWTVPLGDGPRRHPALAGLDLPPLGSGARGHVVATKTLLFANSGLSLAFRSIADEATAEGAGPDDWRVETPALRAFDKSTGELVGEIELPAHTDGSPVTFLHRGRQYIVFALGGRGSGRFELIAYRLPA